MTGKRRLGGRGERLEVANLSHHYDVGVLPQKRFQRLRECEADLFVDLYLLNEGELVLYGILYGQHLVFDAFDLVQGGIEGRRLSAAGGAREQNYAVGLVNHLMEGLEVLLFEPQLRHLHQNLLLVENTHHYRLAVQGGGRRESEVVLFSVDDQHEPAVLRLSALGYVEVPEYLYARGEGGVYLQIEDEGLVKHAVHPGAHRHLVGVRLYVQVARVADHGIFYYELYELQNGALFALVFDAVLFYLALHFGYDRPG